MVDPVQHRIRSTTTWSIVLSVLMIIAGILGIVLPPVAGLAVTVIIAWLLVMSGILHLIFAWRAQSAGGVVWELLVGIVYLVIGFWVLANPVVGLASLTLGLGIYLFIEAILEFILAFRLRGVERVGWIVFDGIVSLVLAIMIWSTWPSSIPWVIGTLVGVSMFIRGISRLTLSVGARRAIA